MELLPTEFFITSGKATSETSDLNAFDVALIKAGIGELNLVAVSSVIPKDAEITEFRELSMGAVTHCVLSQMRGHEGEMISAGIAYAYRKDGNGGYVAEGHIHGGGNYLRTELEKKMKEMGRIRGVELEDVSFRIEEMKVPLGEYGCCLAALVFTEYR